MTRRSLLHLLPALALVAGAGSAVALSVPSAGAAVTAPATAHHAVAPRAVPHADLPDGYWLATADGSVFAGGPAKALGGTGTTPENPVVGIAGTHDGNGYWLVEADGNVLPFGSARSHGTLPAIGTHVNDIVAIAPTGDDGGYWLIGRDGGEFAFGDAKYHGSLPGLHIHVSNIVGMVATSDGGGYWLVGSDGGVFAFGNAHYRGSLPNIHVRVDDIRAMIPSPTRNGYILVGADGGTFVFGSGVNYLGSLPGRGIRVSDIVGLALTGDAGGYWLAGANAATYAFGDAPAYGTPAGITSHLPVVAIATAPPPVHDTTTAAWAIQATPAIGSQLNGVKCLAVNSCEAVGWAGSGNPQSNDDLPLAEHWDGAHWTQQTTGQPSGAISSSLGAVSCTATNFCMAVGSYSTNLVTDKSLAEVWNGTTWSAQLPPFATGPGDSTELTGVSCTSSHSCLAVGFVTLNNASIGLISALWTGGSTWTAGRPVNPSGSAPQLFGVSCGSSTSCFAVGNFTSSNSEVTLIEKWSGSSWSLQQADEPGGATAASLSAVACVNSNDCAAVGDFVGATGPQTTLAENWNGKGWAVQQTPGVPGSVSSVLTGVSCPFSTDCVAVGAYTNGSGTPLTTAEAWNGTNWSAESTVSPGGSRASYLNAASCGSSTFCTAVGNQTTSAKVTQALAEQWTLDVGTVTTLTSSADPITTGEPVTFTASVAPTESGFGTLPGSVTFTITDKSHGAHTCSSGRNTVALPSSGIVTCSIPTGVLAASESPYTVVAAYSGSANFKRTSATLTETVNEGSVSFSLTSSANPAVNDQPVTFTASVKPEGSGFSQAPGTVTFTITDVTGNTHTCSGGNTVAPNSNGIATCAIPSDTLNNRLSPYKIVADYSGSSDVKPASASLTETVNLDSDTVTVTSNENPAVYSQEGLAFTATVTGTPPSPGTPTGNVTFTINGQDFTCPNVERPLQLERLIDQAERCCGTVALDAEGQATCPLFGFLAPGDYSIGASYAGDSNFLPGSNSASPLVQVVDEDGTSTSVTSNNAGPFYGEDVTFTSVTTADSPGDTDDSPQGVVTFTATLQGTSTEEDLNCNQSESDQVTISYDTNLDQYDAICDAPIIEDGSPDRETWVVTAAYSDPNPDYTPSAGTVTEALHEG
jgi:hypothetical protein